LTSHICENLEPLHVSGEGAAELKESHPQSKDIELLDLISWYPHSSHLLRAHVEVGTSNTATGLPLRSRTSRIQGLRISCNISSDQAKISDLQVVLTNTRKEDVGRLQVPVDQALLVNVDHCLQDLEVERRGKYM